MLTKRMLDRAFKGDRTIMEYTYPKDGYRDIEIMYMVGFPRDVPYLGEVLFPRNLRRTRVWINARINFEVDETFLREFQKTGESKYLLTGENLWATAQTKPTIHVGDAIADYGLVVEDVGEGRVRSVSFLLYTGPYFPRHLYDSEPKETTAYLKKRRKGKKK